MAVYITGDIHGSHSIRKLAKRRFSPDGLTRDDYVIILGDFGLVWHDPPSSEDRYWLDWLEERPWTTLFIDGNHENHAMLADMPLSSWHGGDVHFVRSHVIHLTRGQVFDIGGSTFFTMGGAHSSDKKYRKEGRTWWPEEVPSAEERARAVARLDEVNWEVDYVLTHCPPTKELFDLVADLDAGANRTSVELVADADEYNDWLQAEIADKLRFKRWFYGHMHVDRPSHRLCMPLYDAVLELEGGAQGRPVSSDAQK